MNNSQELTPFPALSSRSLAVDPDGFNEIASGAGSLICAYGKSMLADGDLMTVVDAFFRNLQRELDEIERIAFFGPAEVGEKTA